MIDTITIRLADIESLTVDKGIATITLPSNAWNILDPDMEEHQPDPELQGILADINAGVDEFKKIIDEKNQAQIKAHYKNMGVSIND